MSSQRPPSSPRPPQLGRSGLRQHTDVYVHQHSVGGSAARPIELPALDLLELSNALETPDFQRLVLSHAQSTKSAVEDWRTMAGGNALALWQANRDEPHMARLPDPCDHYLQTLQAPQPGSSSYRDDTALYSLPRESLRY